VVLMNESKESGPEETFVSQTRNVQGQILYVESVYLSTTTASNLIVSTRG
jgi:hypothetical protein